MEQSRMKFRIGVRKIVLAVITFVAVTPAHDTWRVVIDPWCTATVTANLASQKAIEDQHNKRLDSIASKKQKLEMYTVSMATIKEQLLLDDKMNGEYDKYSDEIAEKYGMGDAELDESIRMAISRDPELEKRHREATERKVGKLNDLLADSAATDGEKENARNALMRLMPELTRKGYMAKLDKRIDAMEVRKRKMRIESLSFNTFYEYACQRIPLITQENHIHVPINEFATLLKNFYKGGELEDTLNNDVDASLFDEKFIVFEIDAIKDDPLLFQVVTQEIQDTVKEAIMPIIKISSCNLSHVFCRLSTDSDRLSAIFDTLISFNFRGG